MGKKRLAGLQALFAHPYGIEFIRYKIEFLYYKFNVNNGLILWVNI